VPFLLTITSPKPSNKQSVFVWLTDLTVLLPVFIAPSSSILRNNRFRGLQECGIKLLFSPVHPPRKLVVGNGGNNL